MAKTIQSTPAADGFRMPGEFEPHNGCWIIWPERPDEWRLGGVPAQQVFVEVAKAIAESEPVTVCVSQKQYENARHLLPANVRVVEMSTDDAWIRDCGPTFVVNDQGELRGVDWDFNAWGGLEEGFFFPWDKDDLVAQKVLEICNADRYKAPFVLEGGSVHVDGEGTCLTTEECLLEHNNNPEFTKDDYERELKQYLGVEKVIWLKHGVYLDSVWGHVDNLCCFIRPGVVALTWTDDTSDPQYEISQEAYQILSSAVDAKGRKFEIHKVHQPDPLHVTREELDGMAYSSKTTGFEVGERMAASYINFYIANGVVVVPTFDDPVHDKAALQKIQEMFPERKVTGVPGREILLGGGNVHCITQQQPRV